MRWFLSLATRVKLLLAFGLIILLLAGAIATAYRNITAIQASQKQLFDEDFADAIDLMALRVHQNAVRTGVLTMITAPTRAAQDRAHSDIEERDGQIDEITRRLVARHQSDPRLPPRLEELASARDAYFEAREREVVPLIHAGKIEEAKQLVFGIQEERQARLRSITSEVGEGAVRLAQRRVVESEGRAAASVRIFVVVALLALGAAGGMVVLLDRLIARPLVAVAALAGRAASGDLTVSPTADPRADEVGVLTESFRDMIESLRAVNREIREGVNILGSSASEILAATTQVASGAAETATAVGETTTTIEEVRQTAQVSSQKARYVAESAQKAAQVSQAGKKSVEAAVLGMRRIQEQMDSIAGSILTLSEHSRSIGEIVATVKDLAEQSNLLAVNAAIEAAKAGEQGRGFAVVASEVRSLAEQSKLATVQVRAILGDIQKSTSAAVMATEQGSKAVAAGVEQSTQAGESIRVLADSVAEAAQAATQIAASSQQQLVGMDQVTQAMENIKQATTQNAAGTKQAESAAQGLLELGRKLKALVERYRA